MEEGAKQFYVVAPTAHLVEMFCRLNHIPKRDCHRVVEARGLARGLDVYIVGPVGGESARTVFELKQYRGATLHYADLDTPIRG